MKLSLNLFKLLTANFISILWIGASWAIPKIPGNPRSPEAFATINSYYGIDQGLPRYYSQFVNDEIRGNFIYRHSSIAVSLPHQDNPITINVILKLPLQPKAPQLPAIALFTGLQTGEQSVDLVDGQGDNILMSIQYPFPIYFNSTGRHWTWDWKSFESIPVFMTATLHWLLQQPFVDPQRINVLSVSFGTLFTPLTLRWAEMFHIPIRTTTLGYGGGNIPHIVGSEIKNFLGPTETTMAQLLLAQQTWIYDPQYHVEQLRGEFLIVHGANDQVFPIESRRIFDEKIGANKTIVNLPGPHLQPDRPDLIQEFIKTALRFLTEKNAIN